MLPTSRPVTPIQHTNTDAPTSIPAPTKEDCPAAFVACFILPARQMQTLISLLQEFLSTTEGLTPTNFTNLVIAPSEDSTAVWLTHPEAARCLGISTTTLYRYVEQERIEFRKIGHRLEYRRSTLDQFKDQHVRPARRSVRTRGIIPSAPNSGK